MRIPVFSASHSGQFASEALCDRLRVKAFVSACLLAIIIAVVGLAACSRSERRGEEAKLSKRVVPIGKPVPKGGGRYKVGNPYQVAGDWYRPKENPRYDNKGIASWYGDMFHGRYTANGEIFDMNALTAAHPTLPMPVYAQVTNLENGRSIVVRVNDRGPFARGREIDLSKRSAKALGIYRAGTGRVRVRYLGKAPLNGDDSYERQVLASQPWARVAGTKAPKIYARPVADSINVASVPAAKARTGDPMMVAAVPAPARKPEKRSRSRSTARQTSAIPPSRRASARSSMVFVQAGAFRSELNADDVRRKLQGIGTVHVYPAEVNGTIWYRVRLGPFPEKSLADETLRKVVASGATGAHIVRH